MLMPLESAASRIGGMITIGKKMMLRIKLVTYLKVKVLSGSAARTKCGWDAPEVQIIA